MCMAMGYLPFDAHLFRFRISTRKYKRVNRLSMLWPLYLASPSNLLLVKVRNVFPNMEINVLVEV